MSKLVFPLKNTNFEILHTPNSPNTGGLFGYTRNHGKKQHLGVDLKAPQNTEVNAFKDGQVALAESVKGYGKVVYLNHADGTQTRYAHLASISVKKNDILLAGDILGTVGTSGNAPKDKPQLHFELRKIIDPNFPTQNHASKAINPLPFLQESYEQSCYISPDDNPKNLWLKLGCIKL